jgi:hypothetical protein
VSIQSQTGACFVEKWWRSFWRDPVLRSVVPTRRKLTKASLVIGSITGDTVLGVSGCLGELNESLGQHSLFPLRREMPTLIALIHKWIYPGTTVIGGCVPRSRYSRV